MPRLTPSPRPFLRALHRLLIAALAVQLALPAFAALPNDPYFSLEYFLRNTGQSGGTVGGDIGVENVWVNTTGSSSIVVAVISTGVDVTHTELSGNIWQNSGETPGNSTDDDNNGFVDDVVGWDFDSDDNTPQDDDSLGTHMAGIIGATTNNATGVAGINWNVSIMSLRATTLSAVVDAIGYATDNGADVIMLTYSTNTAEPTLKTAIENSGLLVVVGAGNNNDDIDTTPLYPASYDSANLLTVTAVDRTRALSGFSNYGTTSVDLVAPGVSILSITPDNTYSFFNGTNQAAAPHSCCLWTIR